MSSARADLARARVVFWDFDGVVKESVDVKTRAFETLFEERGHDVAARVRRHHEQNSGVSRFEKMPLYLRWAGIEADEATVALYCERLADLVKNAVVDAPWVPGIQAYLCSRRSDQYFVLTTATPEREIKEILHRLNLTNCFQEVFGAPTKKPAAIRQVLIARDVPADAALMVGDGWADYEAARETGVRFLLRRTAINRDLQAAHDGNVFDDLT